MKNMYSHIYQKNISLLMSIYLLTFALFLGCFFPIIKTLSSTTYWSNYKETTYAGGTGSSNDPFIITSGGQLYNFISSSGKQYAKLGSSIDLSAHVWNSPAIAKSLYLDGDGKTITNLKSTAKYSGLIGHNPNASATIEITNLTITVSIDYSGSGDYYLGSFVGSATGNVKLNKCIAYGNINSKSTSTSTCAVGGMIGYAKNVDASQCINYVNLSAYSTYIGGIAGRISTDANFNVCGNNGEITATSGNCGGIVGKVENVISFKECFNGENITCTNGTIGGLIGQVDGTASYSISSVYNTGVVKGKYAGGFIGGTNGNVSISYAYNSANVSSTENSNPKFETEEVNININNTAFQLLHAWSYQTKSLNTEINKNNMAQTLGTGGGDGDDIYNPKVDKNIYFVMKDISYVKQVPDISIVNTNNKIISKDKVYTIKPNSVYYGDVGQFYFKFGFCGKDGNNYVNENQYNLNLKNFSSSVFGPYSYGSGYEVDCTGSWWYELWGYESYHDEYYHPTHIHLNALKVEKTGNELKFTPYLYVQYQSKDGSEFGLGGHFAFKSKGTYTFTIPEIPDVPTFYTQNQIKSASLGDNFAVDKKVNNGMPYLKNFYW